MKQQYNKVTIKSKNNRKGISVYIPKNVNNKTIFFDKKSGDIHTSTDTLKTQMKNKNIKSRSKFITYFKRINRVMKR